MAFKTIGSQAPKKPAVEYYEKLQKMAKLKGKYKYRERHNATLSEQLKSIGYKYVRKDTTKKKKEDSETESDDDDKDKK